MPALTPRSASDTSKVNSPIIIAGIAVIGAIALGFCLWLALRFVHKRNKTRRENARGAAFLTVRGLVREDAEKPEPLAESQFSRANLTADVPMPAKAVLRPDADKEEVMEYYSTAGAVPKPFAPFAFALHTSAAEEPALNPPPSPGARGSWRSSFFNSARGSFAAPSSHRLSTASSVSGTGMQRKVRQVFNPVLPDELLVALGETVSVVQSHDDGWCIVGRDSPFNKGEVELGACPAWCFVKPVKGLKAERPIRGSSLGVTVQLDAPQFSSRDDLVSWSNF